jgi:uncharacterized membrane protein YcfT
MRQSTGSVPLNRLSWADAAKGISIVLVVMMHATLGTQEALGSIGWLNPVVEFAKPFRVPAFFLVAGYFFAPLLTRPVAEISERRLSRYMYFFLLWTLILLVVKGGFLALTSPQEVVRWAALALIEPHGSLWFIHALALFSVAMVLLRGAPHWFTLGFAAALHLFAPLTGWTALDEFTARFVFFAGGAAAAPLIARLADSVMREKPMALTVLGLAVLANTLAIWPQTFGLAGSSLADAAPVSLLLGFNGGLALILMSALIAGTRPGALLAALGRQSLTIYLAFTIPMVAARMAVVKTGLITDAGPASLVVVCAAVFIPLVMHRAADRIGAGFLFEMPPALKRRIKASRGISTAA